MTMNYKSCTYHLHSSVYSGVLDLFSKSCHPNVGRSLEFTSHLNLQRTDLEGARGLCTLFILPLSWCVSADVESVEGASKTLEADDVTILVPAPP